MARYFFHMHDGTRRPDRDGVELAGPEDAEREAVVFAAEWLQDHPVEFLDDGHLTVCMEDANGLTLLHVEVSVRQSAANPPGPRAGRGPDWKGA